MAQLKVTKSGPPVFAWSIERRGKHKTAADLEFNSKGVATMDLGEGLWALGWAIEGTPGQTFSYDVTVDDEQIESQEDAPIGDTGTEAGAIAIKVLP
jgi:hypothetical protein